mgnify:CR=1 FL=1
MYVDFAEIATTDQMKCMQQSNYDIGTFRYIFLDTAMETGLMAAHRVLDEKSFTKERIYNHRNEKTVIETKSVV